MAAHHSPSVGPAPARAGPASAGPENMVTSPQAVFIRNDVSWSVRQTRPVPTWTLSIRLISTRRSGRALASRAASRSATARPRGPEPTMAIR